MYDTMNHYTALGTGRGQKVLEEGRMRRALTVGVLGWAALCAGPVGAGSADADDGVPPFHVLSSQDLCNLIWPNSEPQPDPAVPVGTLCVLQGGLLLRLHRDLPDIFAFTAELEPGKVPELPYNSERVNPNDPLSDWLIPDCYVPDRIDCR
jgi:hypothetical protein